MEIVYAAQTESATFMLDERGVCRWAVPAPGWAGANASDRIVGAQFVASLDLHSGEGLAPLPKVGMPMLFAVVDESGHISLVRTPPLLRFEDKRKTSGVRDVPPSIPMPLTRPLPPARLADDYERTPVTEPKPPRMAPPSDPVVRRSTLPPIPTPPPRMRSDVAPRANLLYGVPTPPPAPPTPTPTAKNNFAPPPAPTKRGLQPMGGMPVRLRNSVR